MSNYAIAMVFSFITACFTFAASWTKDPKRTYQYQVAQCLIYCGAAYFFGVYPAIVMMLINALRNWLIAQEKYRGVHCILFSILAVVLGLLTNTSGLAGLLTILATVQFCICGYLLKGDIPVKVNVAVNLAIWLCYDFLVLDLFSATMDVTAAVLALVTIWRILRDRRKRI